MAQIYKDYIESSTLPSSVKAVYKIDKSIKEKHTFYLNLISFLSPLYPKIKAEDIEIVSSGAYLYFRFLLDLDKLLDEKNEVSALQLFRRASITFEVYEESLKTLSAVFDIQSPFWERFRYFKTEYANAVFSEKQFSKGQLSFTEESFEEIAAGKSAICYASISALSTLNGAIDCEAKLEKCLRHIHIAFQYLDDIEDFKKDVEQDQWSYPQYLVSRYLEGKSKIISDSTLAYKYLFVSGIANSMLDKAILHYQLAIQISCDLGLTNLNEFLQKQLSFVDFFKKEIGLLIEKTVSKVGKSQKIEASFDILSTLSKGQTFLTNNHHNGVWSDFITSTGKGDVWITGFVGLMLSETNYDQKILKDALLPISKTGAFNSSMIEDADSTNFIAGFHWRMNQSIPNELLTNWLSFMNPDGSFSTYRDAQKLRKALELREDADVGGWASAHGCVTAVAAYIMSEIPALKKEYVLSLNYLSNCLQANANIRAYWWTNDLYAISFALLGLAKDHTKMEECGMLAGMILEQQDKNGCWHNPADSNPNAFYTALALKALLAFKPQYQSLQIQQGINWLLNNQTTDGSWLVGRILRIPATDVMESQSVSRWRNSSFGVNTLVDDHNRVFTTAMVVNALYSYSVSRLNFPAN